MESCLLQWLDGAVLERDCQNTRTSLDTKDNGIKKNNNNACNNDASFETYITSYNFIVVLNYDNLYQSLSLYSRKFLREKTSHFPV